MHDWVNLLYSRNQHRKSTILFFFFFGFLGPHPRHMEVPRLGVQSELQLTAYTIATAARDQSLTCDLHHSSRRPQILNSLSKARDRTHILKDTGQVPYCCATMELP